MAVTPEESAKVAIAELVDSGESVTVRAVRKRANTSTAVASEAVKVWKAAQGLVREPVEVPAVVSARLAAVWTEAVELARAEFEAERAGWVQRVEEVESERDGLILDLSEVEDMQETLLEQVAALQGKLRDIQIEHDTATMELRTRADRAEAKAEALTEERDRLIVERDKLQAK